MTRRSSHAGRRAIAPDGDLIVADSHNPRIRRVNKPTQIITTIAGSGDSGYSGDDKPAVEAELNTPNAVFVTGNGDIYVADTLNNRVRMIDHATGFIRAVAGDGQTGGNGPVGDGGPAISAHLFMPSDVAVADNGDIFIADMHHNRVRKVDGGRASSRLSPATHVRSQDDGPAQARCWAGGHRARPRCDRQVTIFIADYYNAFIRAVGPDAIIRNVAGEGRVVLGSPSRVAFEPRRGWLYVADSSNNRIVALDIPKISSRPLVAPRPLAPAPVKKAR